MTHMRHRRFGSSMNEGQQVLTFLTMESVYSCVDLGPLHG
jgi:hypothetical protein